MINCELTKPKLGSGAGSGIGNRVNKGEFHIQRIHSNVGLGINKNIMKAGKYP